MKDSVRDRIGRCPVCGGEIDVLLAPAPGVVGGRVLSFCSDSCRQEFLDRTDGDGTSADDDADNIGGRVPGDSTSSRKDQGRFFSWFRGRSSRILLVVAAASAGILAVVGYHLACVVRYRPAMSATGPAEAAPVKKEPVAPTVISSVGRDSQRGFQTVPSLQDVIKQARAVAQELLHRDGYRLQIEAAEVLLRCCRQEAGQAKKVLVDRSLHGAWAGRRLAAEALARSGLDGGKEILVRSLASPRRSVRLAAALSLARLGDRRAAPVLRSFVGARRYQLTCALALLHLGSDKARRILRRVARSDSARRPDRIRAASALAAAGERQAAELLASLVSRGRVGWPEWLAMARAGTTGSEKRLTEALRYPALRLPAARILFARKMKADPRVLWSDLVASDEEARATAAVAALWLGMEAR